MAFKMKGSGFYGHGNQSPAKKALVGNQANLPEHLKAKIDAAPGKMYDSPAKQGVTADGVEIKSKQQIRQEYKTNKTKSRTNEKSQGDKKNYSKRERKADKMANLEAKQKRAVGLESIGKGEKGFSWKEAGKSILRGECLLGNISSGMGKGRDKSAIIKDKIAKQEGKAARNKIKSNASDAKYYGSEEEKQDTKKKRIVVKTNSKISDEI